MLNKTQLAALFRFAADLLSEGDTVPAITTGTAENNPPVKPRGRPRKTEPVAPTTTEGENPNIQGTAETSKSSATEVNAAPAPAAEPGKPKVTGAKTLEELRALINPLVVKARGPEVKAMLNKYAPEGHSGDYTLALLAERPDTHAAFAADIEALLI